MSIFLSAARQALACAWLLALSSGAWAEQPDPLDAGANTPALDYQSPLATYRRFAAQPRQDWRAANDQVGRVADQPSHGHEHPVQPAGNHVPDNPHGGHHH